MTGIADPWIELTPGALGRLALHSDPAEVVADLMAWAAPESVDLIADWFAQVAELTASRAEEPIRYHEEDDDDDGPQAVHGR